MTEVGPVDRSRHLRSKHDERNAIVSSRKRKLRELYAVATEQDALPSPDPRKIDASPTTPAEIRYFESFDILQGRKVLDAGVPEFPTFRFDALNLSQAALEIFGLRRQVEKPAAVVVETSSRKQSPQSRSADSKRGPATGTEDERAEEALQNGVAGVAEASRPIASKSQDTEFDRRSGPSKTETIATPARPTAVSAAGTLKTPECQGPPEVKEDLTGVDSGDPAPSEGIASATDKSKSSSLPDREAPLQEAAQTPTIEPPSVPGKAAEGGQDEGGSSLVGLRTQDSKLLAAKLQDTGPSPDIPSSPGSTTHTATTPAVHEASTDTSPDNEGLHYVETRVDTRVDQADTREAAEREDQDQQPDHVDGKTRQRANEGAQPQPQPAARPTSSSGDRWVKPTTVTPIPPPAVPVSARSFAGASPQRPPLKKEDGLPGADKSGAREPGPITQGQPPEIPDSEESSPTDQMDVDAPSSPDATPVAQPSEQTSQPETTAPSAPSAPGTPPPSQISAPETQQAPERAVTRVSTGAIRQKSVSEILGGPPRPTPETDKAVHAESVPAQLTPTTLTPQSPRTRSFEEKRKEKTNNRACKVVFGRQPKRSEEKSLVTSTQRGSISSDDYFHPLFLQAFATSAKWMKPIEILVNQAHKSISTTDANLAFQENLYAKVLRKVLNLQHADKWSLRQPKRCPEPTRPPSHWDVLLKEMKWLRADFRGERKWKMAAAKKLADSCSRWMTASTEERLSMQVRARIPPRRQPGMDIAMPDLEGEAPESAATPELLVPGIVDSPDLYDEPREDQITAVPPSAIFALPDDDVVFGLRKSPAADQLLGELPLYGSPLAIPGSDLTGPEYDPDASWRRPALPLSKYVEGDMSIRSDGPPRKRSRYHYEEEEEDDSAATASNAFYFASPPAAKDQLLPERHDVALFNPEMKQTRDRLHAGHQFRPPSEHPMPLQSFYESRPPSQWTVAEEDELRALVREYSYNWSLISSMLTTRSTYTSGAERRTPWECFERWINLEGLPADMQKTQYFKAYNSRIEAAQKVIAQHNQVAQQQAASSGAVTPVHKRRQTAPMRVERRRNQKHLSLIDAMRKLAKKRETAAQKQQHQQSAAAMRKATEAVQPRPPTKTPRDYSLMRWERDQALAERMAQYHRNQEAQRRQALQARQGQVASMVANPGAQVPPNAAHIRAANALGGVGTNVPNQLAVPGPARPALPIQAPVNGMGAVPTHLGGAMVRQVPINGVPQAQLQAMQAQVRMPMTSPQSEHVLMQARRISEQQRAAVQMQHQQSQQPPQQQTPQQQTSQQGNPGPQTSPQSMRSSMNGINQQNFLTNAQAVMASFNAANGTTLATPPTSGLHMPAMPAGSPRPHGTAIPLPAAAFAAQLAQFEAQYRLKNPTATPEQIRQLATDHLNRLVLMQRQSMSQSAMNAAAGGASPPGMANGLGATASPQQYAAMLRQQQQQQQQQAAQQAAAAVQGHQRNSSGSATPSK